MSALPVCPYCDAEVPAHILKAHMAICSDSQRSTPLRPMHASRSGLRQGDGSSLRTAGLSQIGCYSDLVRKLPSYRPNDALEDAALDALLSPNTDASQLLRSLVPSSYAPTAPRVIKASTTPALTSPPPPARTTNVSTALFTRAERPEETAGVASTAGRRSASSLVCSRESTRRPSPLEQDRGPAEPTALVSHVSAGEAEANRERLSFLELACDELRRKVGDLQRENQLQRERHDVLEETLYNILQHEQSRPQLVQETRAIAPPQSSAAGENHYSDIDLLSRDGEWDMPARGNPHLAGGAATQVHNAQSWTDIPPTFY